MDVKQAEILLERYQLGQCTEAEKQLVEKWCERLEESGDDDWTEEEKQYWRRTIQDELMEKIRQSVPVRRLQVKQILRWSAAAAILIIAAGYWLFFRDQKIQKPVARQEITTDVKAPERTTAYILLPDGRKISIDSLAAEAVDLGSGAHLQKSGEFKVAYVSENDAPLAWNTLVVPKGSKPVTISLADQTDAWIDAGSSLTYPTAFHGNDRKVKLSGQAYFEVVKNASKKFIVDANGTSTEVLGTHFNICAFSDDPVTRITLLEGSVRVIDSVSDKSRTIQPGQQVVVNETMNVLNNVDLAAVMAWKNGLFSFKNTDISEVLKQLERWYNVKVVVNGKLAPLPVYGKMQRDLTLAQALSGLKEIGLKYKIGNGTLFVGQ